MAFRLALFYAAIFLFIGVGMPFWPVWLSAHGVDAAEIGVLLSVTAWIRALAPPLIAQAADRKGERKRVIVALAVATLGAYALFTVAEGFWPLLAVSALAALAFGAVIPLGENLAMLTAQARGFDYGRLRLWGSLTFIVGATFGGRLLEGRSEDVILWLILGALALSVGAAACLPGHRPPPVRSRQAPILRLLGNRVFVTFLIAVGLVQASHAVYYGFATLHWRAAGLSTELIGALWAEGVIAEIILFAFSGAVVRRLGPVRLFALAAAAGMVRWTVLAATTDLAALIAVQALHAFTFGAAHLATMHFLFRAIPAEYSATAQSLYAGLGVGVVMGFAMIGAGALYSVAGDAAFQAMSAMALAGGIGVVVLARLWSGGPIMAVEGGGPE